MRLIVDGTGRYVSFGGDSLAAGDGQQARDTKLTQADLAAAEAQLAGLGGPGEVWHDAAADAFRVRARAATADESAATDRRARLAKLDQDIAGYAGLSATDRAAANLNGLIVLRAVVRRLLGE